jgi:hypothetical protein
MIHIDAELRQLAGRLAKDAERSRLDYREGDARRLSRQHDALVETLNESKADADDL